jgi:hypothetical protein
MEVIRNLCGDLAVKVLSDALFNPPDSVVILATAGEASEIIGQVFTQTMIDRGLRPYRSHKDSIREIPALSIGILSCGVKYSPSFHDGFLGESLTERTIGVTLAIQKYDRDGRVRLSQEYSRQSLDTIAVDKIRVLEDPAYRFTRGDVPQGSYFDSLLTPLIILGSLGLAVYLLFSVRS